MGPAWNNPGQTTLSLKRNRTIQKIRRSGVIRLLEDEINEDTRISSASDKERAILMRAHWIIKSFKLLGRIRWQHVKQNKYFLDLKLDSKRLEGARTTKSEVDDFKDFLRIKEYIGQKFSCYRLHLKQDVEKYWIILFIDRLVSFMGYKKRNQLIANLLVYFHQTTAICGICEDGGKRYQFFPCGYKNGKVVMGRVLLIKNNGCRRQACSLFYSEKRPISDCDYCNKEVQNVSKRLHRANVIFAKDLSIQSEQARLAKVAVIGEKRKQLLIRGHQADRIFNLLQLRSLKHFSKKVIYSDALQDVFRKFNVPPKKYQDFYHKLCNDKEFLQCFNFIIRPHTKDGQEIFASI